MIFIRCSICDKEMQKAGALVLSEPLYLQRNPMEVLKWHICVNCFKPMLKWMMYAQDQKHAKLPVDPTMHHDEERDNLQKVLAQSEKGEAKP